MSPAIHHLTIRRGIDWPGKIFICKDEAGAVVPLAGWSAYMEMRAVKNGQPEGPVLLDFLPTIEPDDADGRVTVPALTHAATVALPAGTWGYDLILETPAGKRLDPTVSGNVTIPTPITQPA